MGEKAVRDPKQVRGIQTKEKVIETAYRIFCEKGYFNTTTNEIAKEAGVPIGSLYAYFKDKDTILMEILRRYHQTFEASNADLTMMLDVYKSDRKAWLRQLIGNLIRLHEAGKELNREMEVLCYYKPEVAAMLQANQEESRKTTADFLYQVREDLQVQDIEAAAIVAYDTISAIVHRIVFKEYEIDRERIIQACVEEVYKFLMG